MKLTGQVIEEELQQASPAVMSSINRNSLKNLVQRTRTVAAAALPNPPSLSQLVVPYRYSVYQPIAGPDIFLVEA